VRTAVVGLGLIGGSLLRALANAGHAVLGTTRPGHRAMAPYAPPSPRRRRWQSPARYGTRWPVPTWSSSRCRCPPSARSSTSWAGSGYSGLVTDVTSVKGAVREQVTTGPAGSAGWPGSSAATDGRPGDAGFAARPALFDGCGVGTVLEPGETDLTDWLPWPGWSPAGRPGGAATAAEHDRAVAAVCRTYAPARHRAGQPCRRRSAALTLGAGSFRTGVPGSRPAHRR